MNSINRMMIISKIKAILFNRNEMFNFWLLLFMIGVSNSVYSIKIVSIFSVLLYLLISNKNKTIHLISHPKECLRFVRKDKTYWFYGTLIGIGCLNLILKFSLDYLIVVIVGIFFWIANILLHECAHYFTNNNSYKKIVNSIKIFVILNFILSISNLIEVMWVTKTLIPYAQISPPPYGVMSGDLIQGLFAPEHLPNGIILTFLFFYLLHIKSYKTAFISLFTVLLESSNLSAIIIYIFLLLIFILSNKQIKYRAVIFMAFILLFYVKVNPINYYETLTT